MLSTFQVKKDHSYPGERKTTFQKHYNTIGEFYNYILRSLEFLTRKYKGSNQTIFTGDPSKQLFFGFAFGRYGKLINVTDFKSAAEAIREIIREGEGSSPCNPLDWSNNTGDLSHYFLFKSIVEQHEIKVYEKGDGKGDGNSGSGQDIKPLTKVSILPSTSIQR